jgi:exodeoxyribonuclease VII large subunit
VVKALRQIAGARAVLITRGGGEGVQALDDDELIGAVVRSPVPVAVALGHATDDLVLGRVADASFPTPTAFGAWLRSLLVRRRDLEREAVLAGEVSRSRDLLRRLDELQKVRSSLALWRAGALVAIGLLMVAVAVMLLLAWRKQPALY